MAAALSPRSRRLATLMPPITLYRNVGQTERIQTVLVPSTFGPGAWNDV